MKNKMLVDFAQFEYALSVLGECTDDYMFILDFERARMKAKMQLEGQPNQILAELVKLRMHLFLLQSKIFTCYDC